MHMSKTFLSRRGRRAAGIATAFVIAAAGVTASGGAHGQGPGGAVPGKGENNLTVYAGYRIGGELTDVTSGSTWELKDGGSLSAALDIGLDRRTQLQFFVGRQNSALKASGFAPTVDNIGLDITYYHVGGTYFLEEVGRGGYVVGGLGATHLSPEQSGLNSETKFSLNLGIGYMVPLGKRLGLRLEARGYGTLIDNDGGLFCGSNTGCVVQIKGDAIYQGEVMAGLTFRF